MPGQARRHLLPLTVVLLLALAGMAPLFAPGLWATHDGHHQVIRLMHFHQGLADGQLPVRWAGTALCGYGYPLFVFTYRLPFWIAEGWYLMTGSLTASITATFVLTFLTSSAAMYWFACCLTGSRLAACTAAILYLWAPYRFLDVYVRGAMGEAVTFTFIPLLYGSLHQLAHDESRRQRWGVAVALTAAGLVLSHMMIVALLVIPIALWWGYLWGETTHRRAFARTSSHAGLAALCLTAYYWLPAAAEKSSTQLVERLADNYTEHFLEFWQLLRSPWGFGFDVAGAVHDQMSFELGDAQWLIAGASAVVFGLLSFRRSEPRTRRLLGVLLTTFAASIYFSLPQGGWLYALLRHAVVVDLPWKWLSVSVFAIATLTALGIDRLAAHPWRQRGTALCLVLVALWGNRDYVRVGGRDHAPDRAYWTSDATSNDYAEYTPLGFDPSACAVGDPELVTLAGESDAQLVDRRSNRVRFTADVRTAAATLATKVASYPGWRAEVDGRPVSIGRDAGRLTVSLPHGRHLVTLHFGETGAGRLGDGLSLAALFCLGVLACRGREQRPAP
jgi:hypothetical protein